MHLKFKTQVHLNFEVVISHPEQQQQIVMETLLNKHWNIPREWQF